MVRWRPNIVHAWGLAAKVYALAAVGAPVVVSLPQFAESRSGRIKRLLVGRLLERAASIVVPHEHQLGEIATLGIRRTRLVVIPPGVARAEPPPIGRSEFLKHLALPPDARLIFAAGPLIRRGRWKDVIWAAELMYVLHKNSCLVIFGDGPRRGMLSQFVRQLKAIDRVRFVPRPADFRRSVGLADIYWSGGDEESVPLELLDALAAGVPVVASDTAGHRATIQHGEAGFLAELGSRTAFAKPTDRLFRDADLARRIGAVGREVADGRFSLDATLAAHADLYRGLVPQHSARFA
jgi:glycosyltransferase involved in cell wall biosynthesis